MLVSFIGQEPGAHRTLHNSIFSLHRYSCVSEASMIKDTLKGLIYLY